MAWGTDAEAGQKKDEKNDEHGRRGPALKSGAGADAAIIQVGKKDRQQKTEKESRQENGLTRDAVEFDGVELRKNIGGEFADSNGLPRANDEVGKEHHPAGDIANKWRKDFGGVGGFAGSIG